mmetsp:Transcript_19852/g.56157  ORF Transcript_19852/g.56157 Transcript_19852/m.56157 type:complete len:317 (-) Transcript_19852:1768-2718(-)
MLVQEFFFFCFFFCFRSAEVLAVICRCSLELFSFFFKLAHTVPARSGLCHVLSCVPLHCLLLRLGCVLVHAVARSAEVVWVVCDDVGIFVRDAECLVPILGGIVADVDHIGTIAAWMLGWLAVVFIGSGLLQCSGGPTRSDDVVRSLSATGRRRRARIFTVKLECVADGWVGSVVRSVTADRDCGIVQDGAQVGVGNVDVEHCDVSCFHTVGRERLFVVLFHFGEKKTVGLEVVGLVVRVNVSNSLHPNLLDLERDAVFAVRNDFDGEFWVRRVANLLDELDFRWASIGGWCQRGNARWAVTWCRTGGRHDRWYDC